MCIRMLVHNYDAQYSTEQFWQCSSYPADAITAQMLFSWSMCSWFVNIQSQPYNLQWLPAKLETKVTVTKQSIRIPDSQSLTKHDNNTCTGTLSKCAATVTKDIRREETMFTVNISLRPLTFYRDDSNYYCEVKTHTTQRFVSPTTGSIKETQQWYEL